MFGIRRKAPSQSEPVRVVIVGASLDILGGHAVLIHHLLAGFAGSRRVRVSFLAVNPRLPWPLSALQRIKYLRTVATQLAYTLSLLWRLPLADVVHIFSASYFSFILGPLPALAIARLLGRAAILNYHSGEAEDHLRTWPISRALIRRLPTLIVVPSEYLVSVFRQFNLRSVVVANFVLIEKLPFSVRSWNGIRLLSNRNLEPLYNVACTIRAFKVIQLAQPSAVLTIVGDGSERSALEALSREIGVCNVEFLGRIESDQMVGLYERASIFINASRIDNMPMSIIEAFASGLPVVSTRAGGIPFVVASGIDGLLVDCDDFQALAACVLQLHSDPVLAEGLARAARRKCEDLYTWERVRKEWEKLYLESGQVHR